MLDDVLLLDKPPPTLDPNGSAPRSSTRSPLEPRRHPVQTDEIADTDLDAAGVLEVIDGRGLAIPAVVRNVLEPLDVTGGAIPSTPDYEAALDELDRLSEQLATPLEPAPSLEPASEDATPATEDATPVAEPAENVTPSTATATPLNDTDAAPQPVTAEVGAAGDSPLPMIAVAVLAAALRARVVHDAAWSQERPTRRHCVHRRPHRARRIAAASTPTSPRNASAASERRRP